MQKKTGTMVALAAVGTAAAVAYGCMKPAAKRQFKRDLKNTAGDVESIKQEMCNMRQDVTEMARNIKNQF